jgi:hypothetical protein
MASFAAIFAILRDNAYTEVCYRRPRRKFEVLTGNNPARATSFLSRPWPPQAALLLLGNLFRERNIPCLQAP